MSVVTPNGIVAVAPGLMEPVNSTVKPVTGSQPARRRRQRRVVGQGLRGGRRCAADVGDGPGGGTVGEHHVSRAAGVGEPTVRKWFGVPGAGSVMVIVSSGSSDSFVPVRVTVLGSPACTVLGSKLLPAETSTSFGGIR